MMPGGESGPSMVYRQTPYEVMWPSLRAKQDEQGA